MSEDTIVLASIITAFASTEKNQEFPDPERIPNPKRICYRLCFE